MSIPNLIYKIKSKTGIDKVTFVFLFVIVGVGIGAFGLGRISVNNNTETKSNISIIEPQTLLDGQNTNVNNQNNNNVSTQIQPSEKRYVASKNGKMYYSLGCSGAKRIKSGNEVWFNSKSDAEKSGYTLASACK